MEDLAAGDVAVCTRFNGCLSPVDPHRARRAACPRRGVDSPRAYGPDRVGPLPIRDTFAAEAVLRLSF